MSSQKFKGPLVLVILDGWGISPHKEGNAIVLGKTPFYDYLLEKYPHSQLIACGEKVGLPHNQKGNSEAGHLNLGAGRIAWQDVYAISDAISDGTFHKNPAFISAIAHVQKHKSSMHLMGLLSGTQSAHVAMSHLYVLLELMRKKNVKKVFLHLFTDGRDAPQHAAIKYLRKLKEYLSENQQIATICGRFYAMDRNKQWQRTQSAYDLLTLGKGIKVENCEEAILQAYNRGETDEFIKPSIVVKNGKPIATIKDNDSVIFFNLRSDRARQLSKAFVQKEFCKMNPGCFQRKHFYQNLKFVAMTDFGPDLDSILTAFPSKDFTNTLPMVMKDFKQLYIAETEKYAHVTFFFNGGYDHTVAGEEREVVPSPNVKSYAEKPEMSAVEVTGLLISHLEKKGTQFVVVNICNPDMVGHTGNLEAGIKAVETCDKCLAKIIKTVLRKKGVVIVTADHGNVEEMINLETGEVDTEHSNYPVPFILVSKQHQNVKVNKGILADVAPTIIDIFGLKKPKEMTGKSLISK
ncbi:2,3-bisphosphoglycerate-independent phosphoglycerate mutase [Patescibacteria group bacterium]|nr:2,3-bisphosphoglycerate-independent phosphoglycerate mutase [Patescibacteria group bacterium]